MGNVSTFGWGSRTVAWIPVQGAAFLPDCCLVRKICIHTLRNPSFVDNYPLSFLVHNQTTQMIQAETQYEGKAKKRDWEICGSDLQPTAAPPGRNAAGRGSTRLCFLRVLFTLLRRLRSVRRGAIHTRATGQHHQICQRQ